MTDESSPVDTRPKTILRFTDLSTDPETFGKVICIKEFRIVRTVYPTRSQYKQFAIREGPDNGPHHWRWRDPSLFQVPRVIVRPLVSVWYLWPIRKGRLPAKLEVRDVPYRVEVRGPLAGELLMDTWSRDEMETDRGRITLHREPLDLSVYPAEIVRPHA
jgi:hypothetical protein